jgi:hypothetical protein
MRGTRNQKGRKYVWHVGLTMHKYKMLFYLSLLTLPSSVSRFVYGLLLKVLRYSLKNVLAHVEIAVQVKLNLHIIITYFYRDYCSTTRWRVARSYTICRSLWGWYCWCQRIRFQFIWEECHQRYEKTLARRHYSLRHLELFQ